MSSIFNMVKQSQAGLSALNAAAAPTGSSTTAPATDPSPNSAPAPTRPVNLSSLSMNNANIIAAPAAPAAPAPTTAGTDDINMSMLGEFPALDASPADITKFLLRKLRATQHSLTHGRDTLVELSTHIKAHPETKDLVEPDDLHAFTAVMKSRTAMMHQQATAVKIQQQAKVTAASVTKTQAAGILGDALDGFEF